jgi:hypothetical protein
MDVLSIVPEEQSGTVLERAGEGSKLHKKYGVYIQPMGSSITLPENYAERRQELFVGHHKKLRLFGLDPYDLALSKLERNAQVDRVSR